MVEASKDGCEALNACQARFRLQLRRRALSKAANQAFHQSPLHHQPHAFGNCTAATAAVTQILLHIFQACSGCRISASASTTCFWKVHSSYCGSYLNPACTASTSASNAKPGHGPTTDREAMKAKECDADTFLPGHISRGAAIHHERDVGRGRLQIKPMAGSCMQACAHIAATSHKNRVIAYTGSPRILQYPYA